MSYSFDAAQSEFLRHGGPMRGALAQKIFKGELIAPEDYTHQEYPKFLHFSLGLREYERSTEILRGGQEVSVQWTERKEVEFSPLVQDEDQAALVSKQIERANELGMTLMPEWSLADFQRELSYTERLAGGTARVRPSAVAGSATARRESEMEEMRRVFAEQAAELSRQREEIAALRNAGTAASTEAADSEATLADDQPPAPRRSRAAAALAASAAVEGE